MADSLTESLTPPQAPLVEGLKAAITAAAAREGRPNDQGQSALGRVISRAQSTISGWVRDRKPLPAEHVLVVERELGVSRHVTRPDLYPMEESPVAQKLVGRAPISSCDRPKILQIGEAAR